MRRPRERGLVVDAAFRAVRGRQPDRCEREELLALAEQADFAALLDRLYDSDEADQMLLDRTSAALDRRMRRDLGGKEADGAGPRLAFLHIMKVAGTSFSHMLERWAAPARSSVHIHLDELVLMPRLQLSRMAVMAGHIPYEALALLPPSFKSVVVLRDPVARTLSHYRELRQSRSRYADLTLDEFLHSDVYDVPSGNYQARQLAHTIDVANAWITYSPRELNRSVGGEPGDAYPLQSLFDSTPLRHRADELLMIASANLSAVDYVGVTEDLDVLAGRVGAVFGATDTTVPRLHVSEPSDGPDITASQRRHIESRTEVDRELHRLAQRLARG